MMSKIDSSFEVERVLDERFDELGEREYLVEWRGFKASEATWEPRAALLPACKLLIEVFRQGQMKAGKPVIGPFTGKTFFIDRAIRAKEKQNLNTLISSHGGAVSMTLSKTSGYLVVPSLRDIEDSISTAARFGAVVMEQAHIQRCVTEDRFLAPPPLPSSANKTADSFVMTFGETKTEIKATTTATPALGGGKLFTELSALAPPAPVVAANVTPARLPVAVKQQKPAATVVLEETAPPHSLERVPKGLALGSPDAPHFNEEDYEVAKFCCFTKRKGYVKRFIALELHVSSASSLSGQAVTHPFRVHAHKGIATDVVGAKEKRLCWYLKTLPEATKLFSNLYHNKTSVANYVADTVPGRRVGSDRAPYTAEETLPADLAHLVQRLYDEASSFLFAESNTSVKALSFTEAYENTLLGALSFDSLAQAEAVLLEAAHSFTVHEARVAAMLADLEAAREQAKSKAGKQRLESASQEGSSEEKASKEEKESEEKGEEFREPENLILRNLSKEYEAIFRTANVTVEELDSIEAVDRQLAFVQVLRDITSVREASETGATALGVQYRALRCRADSIAVDSPEVASLVEQFNAANVMQERQKRVVLKRIYTLHRPTEAAVYATEIGNRKLLFHGSRRANWLGIVSRGLLLPRSVLRRAGSRTDAGMLGAGIYFSDSVATAAKYSEDPFFIAAAHVALGDSKEFIEPAPKLSAAPEPYHSSRSVKTTVSRVTAFLDSEYVVYRTNQQRLAYLLECELEHVTEEETIAQQLPVVAVGDDVVQQEEVEEQPIGDQEEEVVYEEEAETEEQEEVEDVVDEDDNVTRPYVAYNPNFPFTTPLGAPSYEKPPPKSAAALINVSTGKPIALVSAHIRARVVDFAAELYRNDGEREVEAKFTFPLPDMAAVSGFECYIGDRVVVARVKEKQAAHAEYAEAVSQQHGAYLLDATEVSGVFSTFVGNLPALTEALIKITFIAELQPTTSSTLADDRVTRGVVLRIPANFAPGSVRSTLKPTQTTTQSLAAQVGCETKLTVNVGIEMADEIASVSVSNARCSTKQSATKACVAFQVPLGGSDIDVIVKTKQSNPSRMWVEESEQGSYASMLVFFPDFKQPPVEPLEALFLLDCSSSMRGHGSQSAEAALTYCLKMLDAHATFNVISFGARERRLFCDPMPAKYADLRAKAEEFAQQQKADLGVSDLSSSLQQLYLQAGSQGAPRAIFIFSDGFVLDEARCLSLASQHAGRTRLFVFGTGANPNRGFLLSLARAGAGEAEIINEGVDPKAVAERQLARAVQPSFHSLSVNWHLSDASASAATTAPSQLHSVFNGERMIVYGFLPRDCTQATLVARTGTAESTLTECNDISRAQVYAPPAAMMKGSFLHRLAARAAIEDFEHGAFASGSTAHAAIARQRKAEVLQLSLKHGVLCKLTSFIAVEKRVPGAKPHGPAPLAAVLGATMVDPLPYVSWSGDPLPSDIPASTGEPSAALAMSNMWSLQDEDNDEKESEDRNEPHAEPSEMKEAKVAATDAKEDKSASSNLRTAATDAPIPPEQPHGQLMARAKIVPSRSSNPPLVKARSTKHDSIGTAAAKPARSGGAAYPRTSRKQRYLVASEGGVVPLTWRGAQLLTTTRNCRPMQGANEVSEPPRVTPFGVTAYSAPAALADPLVSWVMRGPLNIGGTCWLDAALSFILLIAPIRTAVLNAPPYNEPPSSPSYKPSPILVPMQNLLRFWLTEKDNRATDFHKKIVAPVEKLWRSLAELGMRYGENQSAATAALLVLKNLTEYGLAARSLAVAQCQGPHLFCRLQLDFKPDFLVLLREDTSTLRLDAAEQHWGQYELFAFIAFRHLQVIGATEVNHFVTVCLSREQDKLWGCGYFVMDDVLQLRPGSWQGCFTACTSTAKAAELLRELLTEVPIVLLRRKK